MSTTTHDESILDSDTDVEAASDEQQHEAQEPYGSGDTPKSFDKFAMKTNNKINELSQSLKDSNKLNAYLVRGMSTTDIIDQDPEFAKRLSRQEEYSELFSNNSEAEEVQRLVQTEVASKLSEADSERQIKEAISELIVDGKRLSLSDRKRLRENPNFLKVLKGFTLSGYDPEEAAARAFKETYPSKANMIETSFLSSSSETATSVQKKETYEDKMRKKFNNPDTYPPFLRNRMKKTS